MYPTPSAAKAAELYLATGAESPLSILVQVHDGMIVKLEEVAVAIDEERVEDRFHLINKICSVIDVLQLSLDKQQGEQIAAQLDVLYSYFHRRLHQINFYNDRSICDELVGHFSELRDGWSALLQSGVAAPGSAHEATQMSA